MDDDLNTSKALAVLWAALKSNIPSEDKYDLAISLDEVLGLGLWQISNFKFPISNEIQKLVNEREKLRKEAKFAEADEIRKQINKLGFEVQDDASGTNVKKLI